MFTFLEALNLTLKLHISFHCGFVIISCSCIFACWH